MKRSKNLSEKLSKNLSKEIWILILVLTFMVTGCSQQATVTEGGGGAEASQSTQTTTDTSSSDASTDDEDTTGTTEISFWYAWTDAIQQNNIDLTDEFNETVGKEKGIHVTAEYQGSYDDVHQKLQAAYIAGNPPAVSVMEIASIKNYAMNGVLEPLDDYIEASDVDMSDFQAGLMENSYYEDSCYGLPYLRSTPIMYMNTTLLENAGLDPAGPTTWDELADYITTYHDKTGDYGLTQYSYIWTLEAFMLEHGSSVLDESETSTNLNTEAGKEVINFFKDLKDQGAVHQISSGESDKMKSDIMNQDAAIWFSSTGDLTSMIQIAEDNGFELQTAYIPQDEQYGVPTGGCNLVMTSSISDEEKQAAWEFINWMTQKEQTIKASINTGYLPSRISAKDSDEMLALYEEIPQYKVALDQLDYSVGRPMNPGYAEATDAIQDALDAMWVNDADVDSTLEELETKVNSLLNE